LHPEVAVARLLPEDSVMSAAPRKTRLSPPLMYAFRSAHQARAAQSVTSLRDEPAAVAAAPPPAEATTAAESPSGGTIVRGRLTSRAPITEPLLKQQVARDLAGLLNTISMDSAVDLGAFAAVRRSILNFGVREVTSRYVDQLANGALQRDLQEAVKLYEPRLIPGTLRIVAAQKLDDASLLMRFDVTADLSCEPVAVPVSFVADIEVDSGKIQISRLASR
jgi:type VI secretion system protein ImpF